MIEPGDMMPFCAGMDGDGGFFSFDRQAGRPALLLLCPGARSTFTVAAIAGLTGISGRLEALGVDPLLLASLQSGRSGGAMATVVVPDDGFFGRCGAPAGRATLLLIDRASRVVGRWDTNADPAAAGLEALSLARGLAAAPPDEPPVLHVPGLLEPALCAALVTRFENGAAFDSGLSFTGPDGRATFRVDHARKCRRDLLLEPDDPLALRLLVRLRDRLFPALGRSFQHEAGFLDRMLIVRYDAASSGRFSRHRDNAAAATAFRQFALSLNLDAGRHEGGDLVFPEYSDRRFHPRTGEGFVFSATLLHEVTQVTRGTRHALLTFVHDAAAEDRRRRHAANAALAKARAPALDPAGPGAQTPIT